MQPIEEEESGMASFLQFWYVNLQSLVCVLADPSMDDSVLTLCKHNL